MLAMLYQNYVLLGEMSIKLIALKKLKTIVKIIIYVKIYKKCNEYVGKINCSANL